MGNTGGNGLPVEDEIERFLNDRYPGAKVVEREYDDGCLELTILHENLRKEVLFDGRNNWLRDRVGAPPVAAKYFGCGAAGWLYPRRRRI